MRRAVGEPTGLAPFPQGGTSPLVSCFRLVPSALVYLAAAAICLKRSRMAASRSCESGFFITSLSRFVR